MDSTNEDGDDFTNLSSSTLSALKEFYAERDAREQQFADLQARAEQDFDDGNAGDEGSKAVGAKLSMEAFTEDWNASQFWYHDDTATTLARRLLDGATDATRIAVVSAPSAFIQLKNLLASDEYKTLPKPHIFLLEYDQRFAVFKKEFVPYDFHSPLKLPPELKASFDRIIVDPPFLSSDCQTKAALTVRWLARSWTAPVADGEKNKGEQQKNDSGETDFRLIACTGERMETLITRLYAKVGTRTTSYEPRHAKGLSNEFRCYANFECEDWTWVQS